MFGQRNGEQLEEWWTDGLILLKQNGTPRMDGLEFLRQLRQIAPRVPVMVMSGYSKNEVSTQIAGMGVNGFIQVPFVLGEFVCQMVQAGSSRGNGSVENNVRKWLANWHPLPAFQTFARCLVTPQASVLRLQ